MRYLFPLLLVVVFFTACDPSRRAAKLGSLDELQSFMTGSYDSEAQAMADSNYFNISLHMYPIWTDRPGNWLYVEQALYAQQDRPYRQRVYELVAGKKKGEFLSRVYELPDPATYVGAYDEVSRFDDLEPGELKEREGCTVYLRRDESGVYRGATNENDCLSTLRGASYATTRVSISSSFVQSWDRGFSVEGQQVWGATEGGYMFFKD